MRDEEFLDLSQEEQERLTSYNDAIARKEDAKANHEMKKGIRLMFERAPSETIPILAWFLFVVADLTAAILMVIYYSGQYKIHLIGLIGAALILTFLKLPSRDFRSVLSWLKDTIWRKA